MRPISAELEEYRQQLPESLRWTPFDFLHHIPAFAQAERDEIRTAWTRPLSAQDDLRAKSGDTAIFAERLAWDSDFFGYGIARINGILSTQKQPDDSDALQLWLAYAQSRDIHYVLAVVPPEDLRFVRTLSTCGFQIIETRLTFHRVLADFIPAGRYAVRHAIVGDVEALSHTAQTCVNPYDRFHADAFITPHDANRMMAEWVEASIMRGFADFVLVPDVDRPRAFCTVKTYQSAWARWGLQLAQSVVLGAVDPAGFKGWYAKLISESNLQLKALGAEHVFWKTQLTNRAAIRTAEKLGYQLGRSEFVMRLVL